MSTEQQFLDAEGLNNYTMSFADNISNYVKELVAGSGTLPKFQGTYERTSHFMNTILRYAQALISNTWCNVAFVDFRAYVPGRGVQQRQGVTAQSAISDSYIYCPCNIGYIYISSTVLKLERVQTIEYIKLIIDDPDYRTDLERNARTDSSDRNPTRIIATIKFDPGDDGLADPYISSITTEFEPIPIGAQWVPAKALTSEEYTALSGEEKQANILYVITDDTDTSSSGSGSGSRSEIQLPEGGTEGQLLAKGAEPAAGEGDSGSGHNPLQWVDPPVIPTPEPAPTAQDLNVYSQTETIIGTWIDGKPIYRKVFKKELQNSTASTFGTITDLDRVCNLYGLYKNSNNIYADIGYHGTSSWAYLQVDNLGRINYWNGAGMVEGVFTVIVEYTKTTDSATRLID